MGTIPILASPEASGIHATSSVLFAENRGQVNGPARFVSVFGMPIWLTDEGLRLRLLEPETRPVRLDLALSARDAPGAAVMGAHVFLTFEGTDPTVRPSGVEPSPTRANYFIGNDPMRWVSHVPTWSRVRYESLYPGVDVEVHGSNGRPEYDLLVAPFADLAIVVVRVDGAEGLGLEPDGSLRIDTATGSLRQPKPRTWECAPGGAREAIACQYRLLDDHRYGFTVPDRDRQRALVIDPTLIYSTFLGGSGNDFSGDIAVDGLGSAVVVGSTNAATDFPVTPGAFSSTASDSENGFVAKFAASGSALEFATFLGGTPASSVDFPEAVAVSPSLEICVAGGAGTANFPTTPAAFDPTYNGNGDMFVTRLTADGSALVYSTFIGGSDIDFAVDITLDDQDRVCLVGNTDSVDFPVTANAFNSDKRLGSGVVARLSADGSELEYSSYLHGAGVCYGLDVDAEGRAHLVGTAMLGLPITSGAVDTVLSFGEGFFAVMDLDAGSLDYASFLGGFLNDFCTSIVLDDDGASYIGGSTGSIDFPTTPDSFDPWKNGMDDVFVVKVSPDGSELEWGTFLGGEGPEGSLVDLALMPNGSICVVGDAGSFLFPVTPDAFDSTWNNTSALFLSRLSADGSELLYSSFFGGNAEYAMFPAVAVDVAGSAYVAASTGDDLFPITPGAFDAVLNVNDACVLKLEFDAWTDVGQGLAGVAGVPVLVGAGSLQPGSAGSMTLAGAAGSAPAFLIAGLSEIEAAFKGGTLVPYPLIILPRPTQPNGSFVVPWLHWPSGLPAGTTLFFQTWVSDAVGVAGFSASNAMVAVTPIAP